MPYAFDETKPAVPAADYIHIIRHEIWTPPNDPTGTGVKIAIEWCEGYFDEGGAFIGVSTHSGEFTPENCPTLLARVMAPTQDGSNRRTETKAGLYEILTDMKLIPAGTVE